MRLDRLLNAFKKNNITVTHAHGYVATKDGESLHFYENGKGSNEVTHLTAKHPDTDAMTDYFCDTYFHTIKSSIKFLNEKSF